MLKVAWLYLQLDYILNITWYIYLPISKYIYFADEISVGCPTARSRLALPPDQWSPSHGNNLDRRFSCDEEVFDSDHACQIQKFKKNRYCISLVQTEYNT